MPWKESKGLPAGASAFPTPPFQKCNSEYALGIRKREEPENVKKNDGYTACSSGECRRPEYLRQGAVSCWGAGSLANQGIVIMAMPFFLF